MAALQLRFQGFAALAVVANKGGAVLAGQVFVAPLGQMYDHRVEFLAHGGEPVFMAQGALLVGHLVEHAALGELAQSVAEHMAGDAQALLEIIEAAHAHKAVAQHQQRPVVADNGQGAGQGAGLLIDVLPAHDEPPGTCSDHTGLTRSQKEPTISSK